MALAQGDPRDNYGPTNIGPKAKVKAKPKSKAESKAPSKAASKPAQKQAPAMAKPRSKAASKDKGEPADTKAKAKSAKASAKAGTTGSATAAAPAEKPGSPRETHLAIPFADRLAMQSALSWTGDYSGPIDGDFNDRLVEAMKAYQKRHKSKITGLLSADERAALIAAVEPRRQEVGWRVVEDPVTGARVGVPGTLATRMTPGQSGTRWSSAQGQLQIETFRIETGATLEAVFEQQKKQPRRRVTFNVLRPDSFIVSGTQGLKKMQVRGYARDGEVRGIVILYDQAMEGTMDPLVTPMTSAFVPFSSYAVASTGSTGVLRRKVEYGTGLVVSPSGHIVTARQLADGCQVIAVPGLGSAERLAEEQGGELALLRVYGAHKLAPIGLQGAAAGGDAVTLVGVADPQAQAGGGSVSVAPGKLRRDGDTLTLEVAPAPGFSGAAALDGQGHVVGMAMHRSSIMAGLADAPRATVVPLARIAKFLEAHDVTPATGHAGAEPAKASVVRVICVRK